jgi:hypothetical protein
MHEVKDMLWTWLLPDIQRNMDRQEWIKNGGKWIIFDKKSRIVTLAGRLGPLIDSGDRKRKYWNKISAICVYSGQDKERTGYPRELGGGRTGYGNTITPGTRISATRRFHLFWFSKFRTILQVTVWLEHCN